MEQQQQPQQQKGGFSFLKCCLIVGCLAVLAAGGAGLFAFMQMKKALDPVYVEKVAKEIVPCEIPAGYKGFFGMNLGIKMAMIGPENMMTQPPAGGMPLMIVLMAAPQPQSKEQLKMQMETQLAKQGHQMSAEKNEEETVQIRGKPVKIEKALSKDKAGNSMLMYVLVLDQPPTADNPSGQEIIMLMGAEKGFDKKAMDSFLGSIK